jgi:hypothetical protein
MYVFMYVCICIYIYIYIYIYHAELRRVRAHVFVGRHTYSLLALMIRIWIRIRIRIAWLSGISTLTVAHKEIIIIICHLCVAQEREQQVHDDGTRETHLFIDAWPLCMY